MTDTPQLSGVSAHLICKDAASAIDFYVRAFGATEMMRLPDKDGLLMHAAVTINGSIVMLMDEYLKYGARSPKTIGGTPVVLHLMVPDVDAAIARAVGAGASIIMAASDMFWGDRYGQIEDPFGHRWSIATHQRDMSPDEIQAALKTMGG
jgi:PhnB protein